MPMLRETEALLPESSDYAGPAEKKKHLNFSKVRDLISISGLIVCSGGGKKFQQQPRNRNLQSDKQNDVLLLQH